MRLKSRFSDDSTSGWILQESDAERQERQHLRERARATGSEAHAALLLPAGAAAEGEVLDILAEHVAGHVLEPIQLLAKKAEDADGLTRRMLEDQARLREALREQAQQGSSTLARVRQRETELRQMREQLDRLDEETGDEARVPVVQNVIRLDGSSAADAARLELHDSVHAELKDERRRARLRSRAELAVASSVVGLFLLWLAEESTFTATSLIVLAAVLALVVGKLFSERARLARRLYDPEWLVTTMVRSCSREGGTTLRELRQAFAAENRRSHTHRLAGSAPSRVRIGPTSLLERFNLRLYRIWALLVDLVGTLTARMFLPNQRELSEAAERGLRLGLGFGYLDLPRAPLADNADGQPARREEMYGREEMFEDLNEPHWRWREEAYRREQEELRQSESRLRAGFRLEEDSEAVWRRERIRNRQGRIAGYVLTPLGRQVAPRDEDRPPRHLW